MLYQLYLPILMKTERRHHTGNSRISKMSPTRFQEVSKINHIIENKLSANCAHKLQRGRNNSINSNNGPANGRVTIDKNDRIARVADRNHLSAF